MKIRGRTKLYIGDKLVSDVKDFTINIAPNVYDTEWPKRKEPTMKVTWDIKNSIARNAKDELTRAKENLDKARAALSAAELKVREAEVVLDWASGLLVGADLMMKPGWEKAVPKPFIRKLYYVPSKSGRRYGHYIEVLENSIRCTCPGFKNRYYCWATREIQKGVGIYKYIWLSSHKEFDRQRDLALVGSYELTHFPSK